MEVLCKVPPAEIQQENVNPAVDKEDVLNSRALLSSKGNMLAKGENVEVKIQEVNSFNDSCPSTNSPKESEFVAQKTSSPTLIESAFKVMKNLFSPDKTKSKSASVLSSINQPISASGSPRSSIYITGNAELFSPESDSEIQNNVQFAPEENSLKNHLQNNEFGAIQSPLTLDPFNNTDESFLTTVSLIDESFHSAVTHLDEHRDATESGTLMDNILNNTRNLDLIDSFNDTLEVNETCLENTTLKIGSFTSEGTKLANISIQSEDGSLELLKSTQTEDRNLDCKGNQNFSNIELQYESSKKNSIDTSPQNKHKIKKEMLEILSKSNSRRKSFPGMNAQNILTAIDMPVGVNNEINPAKKIEMANLFMNKSFEQPKTSKASKVLGNGFDTNTVQEKIENVKQVEMEIENKAEENEVPLKNSNDEQDGCVDYSISTTTVVLGTVDSTDVENMLMSLKADDSGTNTSSLTSFGSDDVICSSENAAEKTKELDCSPGKKQSDETCSALAQNQFLVGEEKRFCLSEGNSPSNNKPTGAKMKLNKSDESICRRGSNEPPQATCSLQEKSPFVDISIMKNIEVSEVSNVCHLSNDDEAIQIQKQLHVDQNQTGSPSSEPTASVISQQSYTILTTHNNLNRPVIEHFNNSFSGRESFQMNKDATISSDSAVAEKFCADNCLNNSFGSEDSVKSSQLKQSTPLLEGHNQSVKKFFRPSALKLHSPELKENFSSEEQEIEIKSNYLNCNFSDGEKQTFAEEIIEYSPVNPVSDNALVFSNSIENDTGGNSNDANSTEILPSKDSNEMNKTFEKKSSASGSKTFRKIESPAKQKLNQTFEKKPESSSYSQRNHSEEKHSNVSEQKLNLTFDISSFNKTFIKEIKSPGIDTADKKENFESGQLNKTYDKSLGNTPLNRTFDHKKSHSPLPTNKTQFQDKMSESLARNKTNKTFIKEKELDANAQKKKEETIIEARADCVSPESESDTKYLSEENKTFEIKAKSPEASILARVASAPEYLPSKTNKNREFLPDKGMNESYISSKSSNSSGALSDISTILLNEEEPASNRSIDDLSGKLEKMSLNETSGQVTQGNASSANAPEGVADPSEDDNLLSEDKLLNSLKDEKMMYDPDLVQLIQEQFSSKDIEKICSVVHDLSSAKLSSDILKASMQFDKSFHENPPDAELKPETENEINCGKIVNPLSPQSFDFLNSIGGKPTGRDFSRESLYVKFDPLVQPSANSLIDFTKEGEALDPLDSSPVNPLSTSICEQLLNISPQKKSEDIVPPLTPLSHKAKNDVSEENVERLKELQNEIYFLKNLYAEREKSNKAKMEEYENQITKLTGESCMLEDKLKASSEREKSLVKKVKEQTQSIAQLNVAMEEYVKVISKLTAELETIRSENLKQIEALSLEKDSYMTHLQNTEAAFTDVHAKYEKSKKTIVSLKANEAMYRNTIAEQTQKLEEFKSRAKEAQENALAGFHKIQEELNDMKASHAQEVARLRAQLRKTELKVEALQESLDQKIKENQQLTAICDELIEGRK